jgi:hypothetical protein
MTHFGNTKSKITRHLEKANQGYFEHLADSWGYAMESGVATICFLIHGILPFTFEHTGSKYLNSVHKKVNDKLNSLDNGTSTIPDSHDAITTESSV